MKSSRPSVPASYGLHPAPGGTGLLPWAWAEQRLAAAHNYWVGSTGANGRPHAIPVWGIWLQGTLLFSTARASRKARNLHRNPAVVVHLESGDEAVILEGRAVEVADRGLLEAYRQAYEVKYAFRPDLDDPSDVTLMIRPDKAFGWTEAEYPGSATRWEF